MLKKILLLLSFFTLLNAQEKPYISLDYGPVPVTGNGELVMGIKNFSYTEYANKQVWVGIYKPGSSNAWKNVQAWKWVPRVSVPFFKIDVSNLSAGDYDIRLFFNNSYKMEAQETFSIRASNEKPFIKLKKLTGDASKIRYISTLSSKGPKAWIGIYPKGSSTAWRNVKAWNWVEKLSGRTYISLPDLAEGTYEARLFYNNSYVVEDKFTFNTKLTGDPILRDVSNHDSKDIFGKKVFFVPYGNTKEKPWIGVYKKGARISKENLLAKGELAQDNTKSWTTFKIINGNWLHWDDYDMVYHPIANNFHYTGTRKTLSLAPGADF